MTEKYKPIEKIVVDVKGAPDPIRPKLKGRPIHMEFEDDLSKLAHLLSVKLEAMESPSSLVRKCIEQLEDVPYIPYPISLSTVDMVGVTYKMIDGKRRPFILMGRRSANHLWQFPGGFRDPSERNVEAAHREYIEETSLELPIERFRSIDDMFVDDRRYRDTPHKITTHIFIVKVLAKEARKAQAADDIFEVRWMDVEELRDRRSELVRDVHMNLFNFIEKYI